MQIGKKVVKVQKIIMTKAEVESMKNKGLVEMKVCFVIDSWTVFLRLFTFISYSLRRMGRWF